MIVWSVLIQVKGSRSSVYAPSRPHCVYRVTVLQPQFFAFSTWLHHMALFIACGCDVPVYQCYNETSQQVKVTAPPSEQALTLPCVTSRWIILALSEMSQQLLAGSLFSLSQTFMVPRWWILRTLLMLWPFHQCHIKVHISHLAWIDCHDIWFANSCPCASGWTVKTFCSVIKTQLVIMAVTRSKFKDLVFVDLN